MLKCDRQISFVNKPNFDSMPIGSESLNFNVKLSISYKCDEKYPYEESSELVNWR